MTRVGFLVCQPLRAKSWTLPKPFLGPQLQLLPSASANKLTALFPSQEPGQGDAVPEPVLFVEDLTDRLAADFPDLWKLGQVGLLSMTITAFMHRFLVPPFVLY